MGRSSWITAAVFGLIFAWPFSRGVSSPAWMAFTTGIAGVIFSLQATLIRRPLQR
jgi:hypothetical protein